RRANLHWFHDISWRRPWAFSRSGRGGPRGTAWRPQRVGASGRGAGCERLRKAEGRHGAYRAALLLRTTRGGRARRRPPPGAAWRPADFPADRALRSGEPVPAGTTQRGGRWLRADTSGDRDAQQRGTAPIRLRVLPARAAGPGEATAGTRR